MNNVKKIIRASKICGIISFIARKLEAFVQIPRNCFAPPQIENSTSPTEFSESHSLEDM